MNVYQIKPEPWARYRAKCAYFAPRLVWLADRFKEIAAGQHDHDATEYTVLCVDDTLEAIRDELNDSLEDVSRYATAEAEANAPF